MAGLKRKKKEADSRPNLVLIIFLVFFVLISAVLGFTTYDGYSGQSKLFKDKEVADTNASTSKAFETFYKTLYRDLRNAIGDKLVGDEEKEFNVNRESLEKGNLADKPKTNEEIKTLYVKPSELMASLKKELDVNGTDYKSNFRQELLSAREKVKEFEAKANAAIDGERKAKDQYAMLAKNQDKFHQDALDRIQKNQTAALVTAKGSREGFDALARNNAELRDELNRKNDEINAIIGPLNHALKLKVEPLKHLKELKGKEDTEKENDKIKEDNEKAKADNEKQINTLGSELNNLRKLAKDAAGGGALAGGARTGGEAHPLVLDINMNKPLWDQPVGKIIRVDLEQRLVAINLGSAHGVQPQLTFNVFGADSSGRAEKQMKGTIEVTKVVDSSISLCRVTSLYDASGAEILLNLETRTKFQRENEIPIKEGDLLFNMFWGTRVAVVGYTSITGEDSKIPAEQIRQMDDFMFLLRRQGMQVDAYVDLRDGKIVGNLSPRTRYLIRGDDFLTLAAIEKPAVKEGDDDKKEPGKEAGVAGERNDQVNRSNAILRKDAIEKGLLIVSAENFANLIGYRKARNANIIGKTSTVEPRLPYAGSPEIGVIRLPDRPPAPPEEKKVDMEEKK